MSKKIAVYITGFALLVVASCLYGLYSLARESRTMKIPEDAQVAFKGAVGESIFASAPLHPLREPLKGYTSKGPMFDSAPTPNQAKGLIEAYRKDPQRFKKYADMLDSAMSAKQVGDFVLRENGLQPPRTSEPLAMTPKLKLDAWGQPFCIIPIGQKVAVVSGGPSQLSCDTLPLTATEIAASNRSLYAGPSDVVVVVVSQP